MLHRVIIHLIWVRSIALALIKEGIKKKGLTIYAPMPNKTIEVEITNSVFIDPSNERLNA